MSVENPPPINNMDIGASIAVGALECISRIHKVNPEEVGLTDREKNKMQRVLFSLARAGIRLVELEAQGSSKKAEHTPL